VTTRLVRNAGSILSSEVVLRLTTFGVYLMVARALDPVAFGQLSLALALLFAAQVTAGFGLRTYLAREVAKAPSSARSMLLDGLPVVVVAALATVAAVALVVAVAPYPAETAAVVLLLVTAAVPYGLSSACEGIFQGLERMHLVAAVNVPVHVAKLAAAAVVLAAGGGLLAVVAVLVVAQWAVALLALAVAARLLAQSAGEGAAWRLRGTRARATRMARAAAPFLGIDGTIALWTALPIVLLSIVRSEVDVGMFNAAVQLMVPVTLVLQSAAVAIFPLMSRRYATGMGSLRGVAHAVLAGMLVLALPAAFGLVVVAPAALLLVYGPAFEGGAVVLQVLAIGVVFRALTTALGQVLLAGMRERTTLRIVVVNTGVTLVVGLLLIPPWGVIGAAVTTVAAGAVNVVQHVVPVERALGRLALLGVAWRPLLAASVMAAVLVIVDLQQVVLAILLGAVVYAAVLAVVTVATPGGVGGVRHALRQEGTRS
jgi:O-antigen/teichoic acid export membrane protein